MNSIGVSLTSSNRKQRYMKWKGKGLWPCSRAKPRRAHPLACKSHEFRGPGVTKPELSRLFPIGGVAVSFCLSVGAGSRENCFSDCRRWIRLEPLPPTTVSRAKGREPDGCLRNLHAKQEFATPFCSPLLFVLPLLLSLSLYLASFSR